VPQPASSAVLCIIITSNKSMDGSFITSIVIVNLKQCRMRYSPCSHARPRTVCMLSQPKIRNKVSVGILQPVRSPPKCVQLSGGNESGGNESGGNESVLSTPSSPAGGVSVICGTCGRLARAIHLDKQLLNFCDRVTDAGDVRTSAGAGRGMFELP